MNVIGLGLLMAHWIGNFPMLPYLQAFGKRFFVCFKLDTFYTPSESEVSTSNSPSVLIRYPWSTSLPAFSPLKNHLRRNPDLV
jgi:hypothetical protein